MAEYKDLKTGTTVATGDKFSFPSTGAKVLVKARPPIAKEVKTD
jgi:hypothetical protein